MKLELKHIAPYLPYGLKGNFEVSEVVPVAPYELRDKLLRSDNIDFFLKYAKPILKPLSDIRNEVDLITKNSSLFLQEASKLPYNSDNLLSRGLIYEDFQILIEHHFDVFGLIEKGLAININDI